MLTLQFAQTTKARNSTFVPPVSGATTQVLLREETSIVKPTFRMRLEYEGMVSAADLFQYNYCYCPEFKRYYFITDIVSYTAVIFDISCECDVLATFREDILNTDAFIMYAESQYNAMLSDSRLPISDSSIMQVVTYPFTVCDDDGCFILTLAAEGGTGDTGAAQSFVLSKSQIASVADSLYSTAFMEQVIKYFTNPMDAVIACKWTPIKKANASAGGDITIKVGNYPLGVGAPAKKTISGFMTCKPFVPYYSENPDSWADYRNVEPYTEYTIWLPGVGSVQIPMINIIGTGASEPQFDLQYVASPCTGDITYIISRVNDVFGGRGITEHSVLTVNGNFGVDVPVATANRGYVAALGNMAAAAGEMVVSSYMASAGLDSRAALAKFSAVENAAMGAAKAVTTRTAVAGTLGGWSAIEDMYNQISVYTNVFAVSDSPSNVANVIGRPLFKKRKLSDMSGLVKCSGAYVETWATEAEHQMIAQYVNSSTNFIFGGLIVE